MKMNYYLLSVAFLILSSYFLSQLSYSNKLSYEIYVATSTEQITSIACTSCREDGHDHQFVHKSISVNHNVVHWSVKGGEYDDHTVQTCTMRDQQQNEILRITAFRGDWKLDEIIWKSYTFYDFIYDPEKREYIYNWYESPNGAHLYNFKTEKNEVVVPKFNFQKPVAEIFVSNFFDDERKIALMCTPNEETNDRKLVDERALKHREVKDWSIGEDYFSGNAYTCLAGWKNNDKGSTDKFFFTAFDDSWDLEKIIEEPYTLHDFTFNPYSRERTFFWSLSKKGLSLYNFKAKVHRVIPDI